MGLAWIENFGLSLTIYWNFWFRFCPNFWPKQKLRPKISVYASPPTQFLGITKNVTKSFLWEIKCWIENNFFLSIFFSFPRQSVSSPSLKILFTPKQFLLSLFHKTLLKRSKMTKLHRTSEFRQSANDLIITADLAILALEISTQFFRD